MTQKQTPSSFNLSEEPRELVIQLRRLMTALRNDLDNGATTFPHTIVNVASWTNAVDVDDFDEGQIRLYTNTNPAPDEYRIYTRIGSDLFYVALTKI